jgi:hypothetical protein
MRDLAITIDTDGICVRNSLRGYAMPMEEREGKKRRFVVCVEV